MSDFVPFYSESRALVIGINSYTDPRFVPLGEAENDARHVADLLTSSPYDFSVTVLLGQQATRQNILDALYDLRAAQSDSRVLVYFAGHGYTETDKFGDETGYLAAVDTIHNRNSSALKLSDITDFRRHTDALHVGFIFDACFSGQALGITRAPAEVQPDRRRAFQVISAGAGDQAVSDYHSMTDAMLEALRGGALDTASILTFNSLGLHLQQTISAQSGRLQIPQFGSLTGHQGDDLVLYVDTALRLPGDLEIALRAENAFVRGGAVSGLIDVARGGDPDMSKLAVEWLTKMAAEDPDERVRGAAQAYFDQQAAPQAEPEAPPVPASEPQSPVQEAAPPPARPRQAEPTRQHRVAPASSRIPPRVTASPARPSPMKALGPWLAGAGVLILVIGIILISLNAAGGGARDPDDTPTPTPVPASMIPGALRRIELNEGRVNAAAFSPDGQILVTAIGDKLVRWNTSDWSQRDRIETDGQSTNHIAFSPDGQIMATSAYRIVTIWDAATNQQLDVWEGHEDDVEGIAFSPDGSLLASAGWDDMIVIWDVTSGRQIARLEDHTAPVEEVAFTPDGQSLASSSWDGTVRLWDVETWELKFTVELEDGQVQAVAASPDGRFVAGGAFRTVVAWELETGDLITLDTGSLVYSLSFSPDDTLLAAGLWGGEMILWDVETWEEVARTEGHTFLVEGLAFSPDSQTLVTGSADTTILIWDVPDLLSD